MSVSRAVAPLRRPPDAEIVVPGSKSLTNRALLLAALAEGTSHLYGALVADDTEAMADALVALGADIDLDAERTTIVGTGGRLRPGPLTIDARLSGTTSRFVLPILGIGPGPYLLDGASSLRDRPMGPTVEAMRRLGADIDDRDRPGHLPLVVRGERLRGDGISVEGSASSQFTSGLVMAGAALTAGISIDLVGEVVSKPYIDMTLAVLAAFGVEARWVSERRIGVQGGGLRATDYRIEPDASAASYFLAAAALTGGRVRVMGLGRASLQGDVGVADVLGRMGAVVQQTDNWTEVRGSGALNGIDVDLTDMPDMAQTIAAVAPFADSPTRIRGVAVIRGHETDRIRAMVTELRRCGVSAEEHDDGLTVHPGTPRPARIETYQDHRMAMSFAVVGLRAPGIEIVDPGCVAKTFPDFFARLDELRLTARGADR